MEETPWVMEAKEEQENFKNITIAYDSNNISYKQHQAIMKLSGLQSNSGGWPWFKGMNDDAQVTTSIITGLGNLEEIGIKRMYETSQILNKGLAFLDNELRKVYLENKKISKNERGKADFLTEFLIGYYYSRSLFKDIPLPKNCIEAYDYLKVTALKEWPKQNIHNKALLALTFLRNDNNLIVQEIVKSIKEYAMYDTIGGMYFKNQETWNYSQNETQALLIRVFAEIKDQSSVEKLTNWLVKQKQAQNWKSSKATAEVCYTLLKNGELKLNATK